MEDFSVIFSYKLSFEFNEMFIWGRNNNHLFRQNHKKTYSLPQKVPFNKPVFKCAAGYDYVFILQKCPGSLFCYYQSGFYNMNNFNDIIDVATTDNMIGLVKEDGSAWIMEFNPEKITNGDIHPSKISLQEPVSQIYMNYNDIFLTTASNTSYHLRRNQWYETKTYSDPQPVDGLEGKRIKSIVPGGNYNYFLIDDGVIFRGQKTNQNKAKQVPLKIKFQSIAASDYFVGVGENGRLYIWGQFDNKIYQKPTEFGKLSQEFRDVQLSGQNGYAITVSGEAWVWGHNANGELGISDYQPRMKPFPLITLQKYQILSIIIGESFTVALTKKSNNTEVSFKKTPLFRITIDPDQVDNLPQKRSSKPKQKSKEKLGYLQEKLYKKQNQDVKVNSIKQKQSGRQLNKTYDGKTQCIFTEVIRGGQVKKTNKPFEKTPRKSVEKITHRSVSPLSRHSRSNSKSPLSKTSKSPYLQHQRYVFNSNLKKKKQFFKPIINHLKAKTTVDFKYEPLEGRKSTSQKEKTLKIKIRDLQEENIQLQQLISVKENVITDITDKIKLLEDAIEEHERSLTARDNMMEEFQKREKEYQIHIDELQKHIDNLIKGNNCNLDYTKERDYFMTKMTQYEQILKNERNHFQDKIKHLQEEIDTYRSFNDKQNVATSSWMHNSRGVDSRTSKEPLGRSKPLEDSEIKMNFIISRIQDSKIRIAKSATKVYEMMEEKV